MKVGCEEGELNQFSSVVSGAQEAENVVIPTTGSDTSPFTNAWQRPIGEGFANIQPAPQYLVDENGKKEEIRAVPGFAGYKVTENGDVYSTLRPKNGFARRLSLSKDKDGYLFLALSQDGRQRSMRVHRLVALAFIGEAPPGEPEVRHMDGRLRHNHYSNLAYGTRAENLRDRRRHGNDPIGGRNGRAILNEDKVRVIKVRLAGGEKQADIARDYKVNKHVISQIATGRNWSHVA